MKKIFVLFTALLLMFSTVVTASADTLTLDSDTEQMLIKTYKTQRNLEDVPDSDIKIHQYYGTMNDGSILVRMEYIYYYYTADIKEVVIGDYLFTYSGCHATLYKDGSIYEIVDAYKKGIINDDTLDQIASVLNFKVIGCTTELDNKTEFEIKRDYMDHLKYDLQIIDEDVPLVDITVEYYGTTSNQNMLVKCSSKYMEYPDITTEEIIGKYIYTYTGNHVLLYTGFSLREIKNEYEAGRITDTELDEIAETLNFDNNTPDTTTTTKNTNETGNQNNTTIEEKTTTEANNTNTSNGAIATGDNNIVMFISIFTVLTFATTVVLIKRKRS